MFPASVMNRAGVMNFVRFMVILITHIPFTGERNMRFVMVDYLLEYRFAGQTYAEFLEYLVVDFAEHYGAVNLASV